MLVCLAVIHRLVAMGPKQGQLVELSVATFLRIGPDKVRHKSLVSDLLLFRRPLDMDLRQPERASRHRIYLHPVRTHVPRRYLQRVQRNPAILPQNQPVIRPTHLGFHRTGHILGRPLSKSVRADHIILMIVAEGALEIVHIAAGIVFRARLGVGLRAELFGRVRKAVRTPGVLVQPLDSLGLGVERVLDALTLGESEEQQAAELSE